MPKQHYSEIIIGAGIAGLSYAYKSKQDFLLIEKSSRLGGSWQSFPYKNSIYEFGPNSFMNRSLELEEMIDAIGFRDQVISHEFKKSKRYFYQDGKLKPVSPWSLVFGDLLSLKAKAEILLELFRRNKPLSADESIHDFFSRRFGFEVADLAGHALKGIWAGDSTKLSMQAALPFLHDLEEESGSILLALIKRTFQPRASNFEPKKNKLITCSFLLGMSSFCEALGAYIGDNKILCNTEAKLVQYDGNKYILEINGKQISCDTLILATKAYQAAEFLEQVYSELSESLAAIHYADIELSALSLPKSLIKTSCLELFKAFGFINASPGNLLGTIFSSEIFAERNLEDEFLFTCFARQSLQNKQSSIKNLIEIIQPYANKILETDDFKLVNSTLINQAIPQYNVGYLNILEKIKQELKPNLKLIGNYIGGVAFKDAIKKSWQLSLLCHNSPELSIGSQKIKC